MKRFLKLGFIGCGRATTVLHLPALAAAAELQAAALCDRDPQALSTAAARFGIGKTYSDYRELIADPEIEAVAVCTPAPAHAEVGVAALEAGKATFIEKPLALNLEDCDRMTAAAAASGAPAAAGHNLRCHTLVERARDILAAGEIGRVQMVRTVWTAGYNLGTDMPAWRHDRNFGGGALTELGVHHIDLWRFLTGREIVQSHVFRFSDVSDDQAAVLHGVLDDGTVCSSALCQRTADSNEIEIFGDRGRLRFSVYQADSLVRLSTADLGGGMGLRIKEFKQRASQFPALFKSARQGGAYLESYRRQWQRFAATARGEAPPACSLAEARAAIAVLSRLNEETQD